MLAVLAAQVAAFTGLAVGPLLAVALALPVAGAYRVDVMQSFKPR
jgi:hypothetical protein